MGITERVKLAVFYYLQCPKIVVGERDMASKKYLQWNKNSLKRRQTGTDMKKGRHEAKKRMQGKNLFLEVSGSLLDQKKQANKYFLKVNILAIYHFSVRGR